MACQTAPGGAVTARWGPVLIGLGVGLALSASPAYPSTLSAWVESMDPASGRVVINGVDMGQLTGPFTWDWGDGAVESGWFWMAHTYQDPSHSYVVRVTAHYQGGGTDFVDVPVPFVAPNVVFDFAWYLFGEPTLHAWVEAIDRGTGLVRINGYDSQGPSTPFTWDWGDGTVEDGWFWSEHAYADTGRNYIVAIIAHYPGGGMQMTNVVVYFTDMAMSPLPLPPELAVSIPDEDVTLTSRMPGYGIPESLTHFDDIFFPIVSRGSAQYVLSAAASLQNWMANADVFLPDGNFQQVVLRDPTFGGMYSLWYTTSVAFGVGDYGFQENIAWSSFLHEMGHNVTLNFPAGYIYGGKIDGNANAIYSETMAQIFQHATAYELINRREAYGLCPESTQSIQQDAVGTIRVVREAYENYLNTGKVFHSWNDPGTGPDETFDTFMTIAYKFFEHAENAGQGYAAPLKRMMRLLALFDEGMRLRYDAGNDTPEADAFRATLMVAGESYAFAMDLRQEFRDLNFPVDDDTYLELMGRVLPGDLNGDVHVDAIDLLILADSFGLCDGEGGYNRFCDLNGDGCVDISDLLTLAGNWGT